MPAQASGFGVKASGHKELLILRFFIGMTTVEIAKLQGKPLTAVRKMLTRARSKLRELCEERGIKLLRSTVLLPPSFLIGWRKAEAVVAKAPPELLHTGWIIGSNGGAFPLPQACCGISFRIAALPAFAAEEVNLCTSVLQPQSKRIIRRNIPTWRCARFFR